MESCDFGYVFVLSKYISIQLLLHWSLTVEFLSTAQYFGYELVILFF